MSTELLVETHGLVKEYGDFVAVDGVDLRLSEGEVYGFLGPNGSGKSTTILMMLGLTEPTEGTVRVCGHDPTRDPIAVKRQVGYLPENLGFYGDLTGRQHLQFTAEHNNPDHTDARARISQLLENVELGCAADQPRDQTTADRAVKSGNRTGARRHTGRERERQGNHGRRKAAVNVTAKIVEAQPVDQSHHVLPIWEPDTGKRVSQSRGAAGSKGPPGRAVFLGFADQAGDAGQGAGGDLEHLEALGLDRPGQDQAGRARVSEPEGRVVGRLADNDAEARARPLGPGQAVADEPPEETSRFV